MASIYIGKPEQLQSPRLKVWREWKASKPEGTRLSVELFRERAGLVLLPPKVIIRLSNNDGTLVDFKDDVPWESSLERWLLDEEKALSTTHESEVIRTDMLLREAFRPIRQEVGSDYFDAVLVKELSEGSLSRYDSVRAVLSQVAKSNPSEQSLSTTRAAIINAFRSVSVRLLLLYPDKSDYVEELLADGVASFMDERFSITNRRMLGLG